MKSIFTFCFLLLFSFASLSQMVYLKAVLEGSQQVPAVASAGSGVVILKYDMTTKMLYLTGDYQNLSSVINASHIHGPAMPGANAPVLFPLTNTGGTTGTLTGTDSLTSAQEADLLAGNMYVNVHSATYPNGEIRGQLTTATADSTDYLTARLQGAQQMPPNGSTAMGSSVALLDRGAGMLYLTGSFAGLADSAAGAHIHLGSPHANGPILISLMFTQATTGTIHVATPVTPTDQDQLKLGNGYVNIHNPLYPDGEIRGQLTMLSQLLYFKTTLHGSEEVPPTPSAAMGTVIVKYNTLTKYLELTGDYQNLSSVINASHIHGPAMPGAAAPVLFPLNNTGGTSGTLSGTATLTPVQEMDLMAGNMYVNVHSGNYPNGEVRGQLSMSTSGQSYYFSGMLSGLQSTPPNASPATGLVTVLLDRTMDSVFVTGDFHNLSAPALAAHIHGGPAGVAGPVRVPLFVTADTTGTITGSALIDASFADSMIAGYSYVNIHDSLYPNGEIRAQLGNLVLPVKLIYFNGYKQNNQIALVWESAQEINVRQYNIEQLNETTGTWITKTTVYAKGNGSNAKYSITDAPLVYKNGYATYRLKIMDNDGSFVYSPAITININSTKAILKIAVNPVTNGQLKYLITGLSADKKADVFVIDFSGKVLIKTSVAALANNTLNIANLAAGMYKLVVRADGTMLQQSFVK